MHEGLLRVSDEMVIRCTGTLYCIQFVFFFKAEDGIRNQVRSRGLGDVYKRQENDLGNKTYDLGKQTVGFT